MECEGLSKASETQHKVLLADMTIRLSCTIYTSPYAPCPLMMTSCMIIYVTWNFSHVHYGTLKHDSTHTCTRTHLIELDWYIIIAEESIKRDVNMLGLIQSRCGPKAMHMLTKGQQKRTVTSIYISDGWSRDGNTKSRVVGTIMYMLHP